MKIFVINPGSTSTKIALFIDEKPVWAAGAHHTADARLASFCMALARFRVPGAFLTMSG